MPELWKRCQVMKSETLSLKTIVKKIGFSKENIPDPLNSKERYQLFITKKTATSIKQSKMLTYQPKTFENPNIVDMTSENPKTSHILSKTIRRAENGKFQ